MPKRIDEEIKRLKDQNAHLRLLVQEKRIKDKVKVWEMAKVKGVGKKMSRSASGARMGRKIKQIRNPSEAFAEAEEVVRKFHGREPRGTIEIDEEEEYEDELGVLGQLMELNILKDNGKQFVPIVFSKLAGDGKPKGELEDMVQLATNAGGRPIYFKGGDQELDLLKLRAQGLATGVESKKGFVIVGPVIKHSVLGR